MISLQPSDEALCNTTPVSRNLFGLSAFPSEKKINNRGLLQDLTGKDEFESVTPSPVVLHRRHRPIFSPWCSQAQSSIAPSISNQLKISMVESASF
jgi:hypothetical protein